MNSLISGLWLRWRLNEKTKELDFMLTAREGVETRIVELTREAAALQRRSIQLERALLERAGRKTNAS